MNEFENIENVWASQKTSGTSIPAEALIKKAKNHGKQIRLKHRSTIAILGITVVGLILFLLYVKGYAAQKAFLGFILMIGSLCIRILSELWSYQKFNNLPLTGNFSNYKTKAAAFYGWRQKVHYWLTPVILLLYISGFILLLPYFKAGVSHGFYLYILISGFVFLGVITLIIFKQARKEMHMLRYLKDLE